MSTPQAKGQSATILCWLPLATFVALFGFATISWLRFGHWPMYSRPDPSALRLPILYGAALLAYPLAILGILAGLVSAVAWPQRWRRHQMAVFLAGACVWTFSIAQAGELLNWLLD